MHKYISFTIIIVTKTMRNYCRLWWGGKKLALTNTCAAKILFMFVWFGGEIAKNATTFGNWLVLSADWPVCSGCSWWLGRGWRGWSRRGRAASRQGTRTPPPSSSSPPRKMGQLRIYNMMRYYSCEPKLCKEELERTPFEVEIGAERGKESKQKGGRKQMRKGAAWNWF